MYYLNHRRSLHPYGPSGKASRKRFRRKANHINMISPFQYRHSMACIEVAIFAMCAVPLASRMRQLEPALRAIHTHSDELYQTVSCQTPPTDFRCPTERSEVGIETQCGGFRVPIGRRPAGPRLGEVIVEATGGPGTGTRSREKTA